MREFAATSILNVWYARFDVEDAADAHSVALAATRMTGLRQVTGNEQLEVLRVLADRRRSLSEDHTRMICQLHRLLLELIPGGAKKALSAAQAKVLPARVRPRDPAGQARRRVAAELVSDLERIHQRKKAAGKELTAALKTAGTTLTALEGIGPSGAARLLVEAGDIARFPDRGHFASWNGTAPIDASSGDHVRHRLSRAGNRQVNRVLHIMAVVQLRHATRGRAYYDRKVAAGSDPSPALRTSHFPDPPPATLRHRAAPFSGLLPPPPSGAACSRTPITRSVRLRRHVGRLPLAAKRISRATSWPTSPSVT